MLRWSLLLGPLSSLARASPQLAPAFAPEPFSENHMNMFKDDPAFKQMQDQADEQMTKLLKATVQDYEAFMADRDAAAREMADLVKQAKDQGLNVKAFKRLIAERKRDREDVMEEARMLETYRNLLF